MKKALLSVVGLGLLWAAQVQAAVFPVDTASSTTLTDLKTDLIAWGVAFIAVSLTIYAYKRVRSIAR